MDVEKTIEFLIAAQVNTDTKIARLATIAEMQLDTVDRLSASIDRLSQEHHKLAAETDKRFRKMEENVMALSEDIRILFKVVGNSGSKQ